ncbi:hypothetical protein CBOM_01230 [Ceraceosorus bombacis]|uniref:Uncharacterized protein n=1 Tax=Ceraceosorus bombacis TaxID=401625 RepID=A0A0P1BCV7_9BASI|nr:hypothetical protein CBOM_01230 [Ceraceosorus bombacis]
MMALTATLPATHLQSGVQTTPDGQQWIPIPEPTPELWKNGRTYHARPEQPLTVANLPHLHGDREAFSLSVDATEQLLTNLDKRLSWKDVEAFYPMSDVWAFRRVKRPRSGTHRHEYMIKGSTFQLRQALIYALERNEMMRSAAVPCNKDVPTYTSVNPYPFPRMHYAVLRGHAETYEHLIDEVEVDNLADVTDIKHGNGEDGGDLQFPGFMTAFTIVTSRNSKEQGMCALHYVMNHAVFDMASLHYFLRDIDERLGGMEQPRDTAALSYGPYAYWRYVWPYTDEGKAAVNFHRERLTGLQHSAKAWPPARTTGWMRGNDEGWLTKDNQDGHSTTNDRRPLAPTGKEQKGKSGDFRAIRVPHILKLRKEHGIAPAKAIKTAVALFHVKETGAYEAVFSQAEGGRMAIDVDGLDFKGARGPMVEMVLNRVAIPSQNETVLSLFNRVQTQQAALSKHSHYHRGQLVQELEKTGDAHQFESCAPRFHYNWAPRMPPTSDRIKLTKFEGRSDLGMALVYRLKGDDELVIEQSWDNAQLKEEEVERTTRRILAAAKWICNPENWNKPIGECDFDAHDDAYVYQGLP